MQTSEVLNRAADLIEERGWTTGTGWSDPDGDSPLCIQGAIAAAMGVKQAVGHRCPAYWAVADYIGITSVLFNWNDCLPYVEGSCLRGYVGGTRVAARALAAEKCVATLRAAAVIESAKENSDTREPVTA